MESKVVKIAVIINEGLNKEIEKTLISVTSDGYKNFQPIFFIKNGIQLEDYSNIDKYYFEKEKEVYEIVQNIKSDYIIFIKEGDTYSNNFCKYVDARIKKEDYIISFNIGGEIKYRYNYKGKGIIRIEDNPLALNIHLYGNVIKKEIFDQISIKDINCKFDIDVNIMTKLLLIVGETYKVIKVQFKPNEIYDDIINNKLEYYELEWYIDIFSNVEDIIEFCKKRFNSIPQYAQNIFMYLIKLRMEVNVNTKNKHILKDNKLLTFYDEISKVTNKIDDSTILKFFGNKKINQFLLELKYKSNNTQYREYKREIFLMDNNIIIDSASINKVKILLMNIEDKELIINGIYPFEIDEKNMKIIAEVNNKEYVAEKSYLYTDYKCFGTKIYTNYAFRIKVKLDSMNKQYVKFFLKTESSKVKLDIIFNKPLARLNKEKNCYWVDEKYILNYRRKSILIMKNTILRHVKRELKYLFDLLRNNKKEAKKSALLRIIYWITKPIFNKKEIWIFQDKIYKGGDNGEYLYKYCKAQKDGIHKYYILDKGCIDAKRFKEEQTKFVKYNSLYHKLLFLNSNIVFATHNNTVTANGFTINDECYFRDLFNYKSICIQHGLSVQYIPHLVNRINDDLKMFFLASDIERTNLLQPEYEYLNYQDILKVTGSPRYDGLKNNDRKIILITPSWRNYLAVPVIKREEKRGYNSNFRESNYFKLYNSIINNEKLIQKAKEKNYKIIYLLHPATSSQINDYDKNENVELIAATEDLNYEKILTESSLMVTDYSGVQFDFAYMYKPIIYYHPNELPPSYDEGAYKYSTMALGEIVSKEDELIRRICEYIDNECKIKNEYKNRIDKFFKYHDYNNCERIYNEVMKKFYRSKK